MYIFELFAKFEKMIKANRKQDNLEKNEEEACNHIFAPLDSTNKIFACTKCGFVVEKEKIENKNFFIK